MPPSQAAVPPAFGLNLIGFFGSDTGLGNTARTFARALEAGGVPISRIDISAEASEAQSPAAHAAHIQASLVHPVNLHMINAGLESVLMRREHLLRPGLMQVGMLWWETTVLPPPLATLWSAMDAVLACSPFIAGVAANHLALTPVLAAKHPLPDLMGARADRELIDVFRAAFPDMADAARLYIRVHHASQTPPSFLSTERLIQAAGGDPRIRILTEPMDYRAVLYFYASGDVYVSLHRAEGLGLGMMEAMALGKPVIATGWSGNMDFMGYDCACPVRYQLGPPRGNPDTPFNEDFLGPNALWAAPVFEDALAWMRRLAQSPGFRTQIGQAAKHKMTRHQDEASALAWASELAALWRARAMLPAAPGKFSSEAATA